MRNEALDHFFFSTCDLSLLPHGRKVRHALGNDSNPELRFPAKQIPHPTPVYWVLEPPFLNCMRNT